MAESEPTRPRCRLYLITPPSFAPDSFADDLADALAGGDVACLQLRLKDCSDDAVRAAATRLMPLAHARDVAFLINDRPDLAHELGADGVHIGQQDMAYADARRIVGRDAIVGVSCHNSHHLAMEAGEAGADYVAFGAFYPTATKQAKFSAAPEILQWWQETFVLPCVAIGGITPENCEPLVRAGADFIAVASGVWDHPAGPQAAVRDFNSVFDRVAADIDQG
ncbi:MAG TPA: thiamine phosphate synthase [Alphaproteobacteria bacterium]|nr:thiamine phosphate synthase [Alphaproteobacteria bacterium]